MLSHGEGRLAFLLTDSTTEGSPVPRTTVQAHCHNTTSKYSIICALQSKCVHCAVVDSTQSPSHYNCTNIRGGV